MNTTMSYKLFKTGLVGNLQLHIMDVEHADKNKKCTVYKAVDTCHQDTEPFSITHTMIERRIKRNLPLCADCTRKLKNAERRRKIVEELEAEQERVRRERALNHREAPSALWLRAMNGIR